jgi:putative oxidoreductase
MQRAMASHTNAAVTGEVFRTILRLVVGVVLMAHGFLKLTDIGAFEESLVSMGFPIPRASAWAAALAEFLGGAGLFFGFWTRLAAIVGSIVMVTAIATVHATNGLLAENGGFEYPLVLLAALLYFLAAGAGRYSMDEAMRGLYEKHRDVRPRHEPRNDRRIPAES